MSATVAIISPYADCIAADAAAALASAEYFATITGASSPNTFSAVAWSYKFIFAFLHTSSKLDIVDFILLRSPSAFLNSCCNIRNDDICVANLSDCESICSATAAIASPFAFSDSLTSLFASTNAYIPTHKPATAAAASTYGFANIAAFNFHCATADASVAAVFATCAAVFFISDVDNNLVLNALNPIISAD